MKLHPPHPPTHLFIVAADHGFREGPRDKVVQDDQGKPSEDPVRTGGQCLLRTVPAALWLRVPEFEERPVVKREQRAGEVGTVRGQQLILELQNRDDGRLWRLR
jgi:hypothetical protein